MFGRMEWDCGFKQKRLMSFNPRQKHYSEIT